MKPNLAVYLFTYNTEKIRYPWRESIRSALDLAGPSGAVYVCDCMSDDGTYEAMASEFFGNPNFYMLRHPWGTSHEIQVSIANFMLDEIGTQYQWALKLDADEVIAEWSIRPFWDRLESLHPRTAILGRPYYTHLCPDDRTEFPFIYKRKAVLSRTVSRLRFNDNDACALGGGVEYDVPLEIMHYGKMAMGREREALIKEVEFTRLYTDLGFPDPKVEKQRGQGWLDYYKVFDLADQRGEFTIYRGPHPKHMQGYLAAARERARAFHEALNRGEVLSAV